MRKSRTVARPAAVESPRRLPLVDLLVDARSELFELAVRSGLKVLDAMLEEDRTAPCGRRYAHLAERGHHPAVSDDAQKAGGRGDEPDTAEAARPANDKCDRFIY